MNKVLAVLQNQWFQEPERVKAMLGKTPPGARTKFIGRALFGGCRTGRVLKKVFGELALKANFVWENASPEIGGHSSSAFPADYAHLANLIIVEQPAVVLAFGITATEALERIVPRDVKLITGPHPVARGPDTLDRLVCMAQRLEDALSD